MYEVSELTFNRIASVNTEELINIRSFLVSKRMELDKMFSLFLDSNKLEDDDYESEQWRTYHKMLKEYDRVNDLYKSCQYRIQHYV